jgi:hypothetical protein
LARAATLALLGLAGLAIGPSEKVDLHNVNTRISRFTDPRTPLIADPGDATGGALEVAVTALLFTGCFIAFFSPALLRSLLAPGDGLVYYPALLSKAVLGA